MLPDGRSSTLFDEFLIAMSAVPGRIREGMLLLSGGIDSPVAGYMMASRGMPIDAVYFHSYPYTSEQAKQKVIDLAKIVSRFSGRMNLYIVDFTKIQLDMVKNCKVTKDGNYVSLIVADNAAEILQKYQDSIK